MITEGFPPNLNASKGSSLLEKRVDSLRQLNTTTVNQLLGLPGMTSTFTAPQLLQLRIIAITASAVSLIAGCLGMFFLSKMDKRRKVFRHDLIAFLIICDFLKAFILMIYPMIILIDNSVYATPAFFNTLGWFTAFAIEGADMAIMIFAIHFAILIFKPNWKWRNKRSGNMEGGLYKKRSYIWPITALVPAILASLAFINYNKLNDDSDTTIILDNNNYNFPDSPRQGGYKPWSAWCYLPPKPYWYKIVLSWGPRYFIIIFIFAVYLSIYIFITSESKRIKAQIGDFNHDVLEEEKEKKKLFGLGHWGKAKWYFRSYFKLPLLHLLRNLKNFFTISFIDPNEETDDSGSSNGTFNFGESSNEIPTLFRKTNTGSDENVSASGGVRLLDYNSAKPLDMSKYAMSEQPDLERNNPFDCENDITLNPSELQ
ncbi:Gpr1p [Saccharomyces cerevisiae]|nr:Gpr1p [Saccharomyces cerevisiae]